MPSPGTRTIVATVIAVAMLALAGCGSSGRELRDYPTGQTAPPRNAPAAGTLQDSTTTPSAVFSLSTDEWTPGGSIPAIFTCDGADVSPHLAISSPPPGTVEMAIVVTDLDRDGLVHWIVAGIDPQTISVDQGTVPEGAVQALAANDQAGWFGPCPPEGETHTYSFDLYALGSPSGITDGQDAASAVATISAAPIAQSTLTATYRR